jgi:hypothetical protein
MSGSLTRPGPRQGSASPFALRPRLGAKLPTSTRLSRGTRYWPEFAAAGKKGVQVRHVLAHTAGLPDPDGPAIDGDLP